MLFLDNDEITNSEEFILAQITSFPNHCKQTGRPGYIYQIIDEKLFQKNENKPKLVIPTMFIRNTLVQLHLNNVHHSDPEIQKIFKRNFCVPNYCKIKDEVLKHCTVCQLNRPSLPMIRHGSNRTIDSAFMPNTLSNLDTLYIQQRNNTFYLIVVFDYASSYVMTRLP